jgi:GT2 family glycosyltransferase
MRIAVSIPIYITNTHHIDFLNQCTSSIKTSHEFIAIIVNNHVEPAFSPFQCSFKQTPQEYITLEGRQPQAISKAWNDATAKAAELNCDYILYLGSDTVLKSNAIDRLVAFAEAHQEAIMWTMSQCPIFDRLEDCAEGEGFNENPEFSAFMIKPKQFIEIMSKGFDENFVPAYFEDNDIHGRIALLNRMALCYNGAKFFHFGSQTINSDQALKQNMPPLFHNNEQYFVKKWGRGTTQDVNEMRNSYFQHPFNDASKAINDW